MLKIIMNSNYLPIYLLCIICILPANLYTAETSYADPVCTITNYRNTDQLNKIPYLQWRRCYFIGKAFYYVRIFSKCRTEKCNWGWLRANRFGPHFISTYTSEKQRNIIQLNFSNPNLLSLNLRNNDVAKNRVTFLKLKFRPY